MALTMTQLLDALPETDEQEFEVGATNTLCGASHFGAMVPVPVGRFQRFRVLGTLQAKIAAGYAFHWLRGFFRSADEHQRALAETHFKTATRILDSMTYLRGAVMKVGQTLANFPDVLPQQFIETFDSLYFQAPPMHWSLLKEMVHNELGDDPENLFESFETRAFAAASLGQVHRATLKTGEDVVVKIQYPGIARTIREDMRNLMVFLLPNRLSRDWDCMKDQFEDLCLRLEHETDYEREARTQMAMRQLFGGADGIVIPRVFPQYSSARVLTMERLEGVHVDALMASNPSDEERADYAAKIFRSGYRMTYSGRQMYADLHPGNFLFMPDGRLGLLDFGSVVPVEGEFWNQLHRMDRAFSTGDREARRESIKEWSWITDENLEGEALQRLDEFTEWNWRCRSERGELDFGDEAEFRHGVDLFVGVLKTRFARGRSQTLSINRMNFGLRSMMYRLKAKLSVFPIAEEEVRVTGWDRSAYALRE